MDALSQKDVDSLLRGRSARKPVAPATVMPYNFRRPPRISRERQKLLEAIHTRFAQSLQGYLGSRLMQPVAVAIASVEQATFSEFTLALGSPCATYVHDLGDEIGAQSALDIAPDFAMHCVDRMFGGPGEIAGPTRSLTELEQAVLGNLADRALHLLRESWGDHLKLQPTRVAFESFPESLRIAAREDNVLIVTLEITAGRVVGLITLCLPLIALESFLQEKAGPLVTTTRLREAERASARAAVEAELLHARLPVTAQLPAFPIATGVIAALQPGQVLSTGLSRSSEVAVLVNNRPLFTGQLGRHEGALAVRLTRVQSPETTQATLPHWRTF
jgi:flagellar motor switch protein FliM